eukprot:gene36185-31368_t
MADGAAAAAGASPRAAARRRRTSTFHTLNSSLSSAGSFNSRGSFGSAEPFPDATLTSHVSAPAPLTVAQLGGATAHMYGVWCVGGASAAAAVSRNGKKSRSLLAVTPLYLLMTNSRGTPKRVVRLEEVSRLDIDDEQGRVLMTPGGRPRDQAAGERLAAAPLERWCAASADFAAHQWAAAERAVEKFFPPQQAPPAPPAAPEGAGGGAAACAMCGAAPPDAADAGGDPPLTGAAVDAAVGAGKVMVDDDDDGGGGDGGREGGVREGGGDVAPAGGDAPGSPWNTAEAVAAVAAMEADAAAAAEAAETPEQAELSAPYLSPHAGIPARLAWFDRHEQGGSGALATATSKGAAGRWRPPRARGQRGAGDRHEQGGSGALAT